jgi:hypothetical protein
MPRASWKSCNLVWFIKWSWSVDLTMNLMNIKPLPTQICMPPQHPLNPDNFHGNYRQVIGMLKYIAAFSGPNISFAVHHCAHFSSAPHWAHELAVKWIIRYLKGTWIKGYILWPSGNKTIHCLVDTDFAGSWTLDTSEDPSSIHTCSSIVITDATCPILWSSKLQSEIAFSTTKVEYSPSHYATWSQCEPSFKSLIRSTILPLKRPQHIPLSLRTTKGVLI